MNRALHGWLLLLPATILLVAFTHYPAVATLVGSFFSTPKGARPATWVGLYNDQAMVANFLWPLIATNSVTSRPLTVGLQIFSSTDQGVDWSIITAATLMTSAPLLIAFLLFQRQFVQSFMRAGIR